MKELIEELKQLVEMDDAEHNIYSMFNGFIADAKNKADELRAEESNTSEDYKRGMLAGQRFGMAWAARRFYTQIGDERLNKLATEIT